MGGWSKETGREEEIAFRAPLDTGKAVVLGLSGRQGEAAVGLPERGVPNHDARGMWRPRGDVGVAVAAKGSSGGTGDSDGCVWCWGGVSPRARHQAVHAAA
jgi:hypothetical protein